MKTKFLFLVIVSDVLVQYYVIFSAALQGNVKLPTNVTIPAVFMFGDSIVDTGNNNNLKTLVKSNFAPYGKDFMGGIPTGRFSNGKVPSDLVVEKLGIKDHLPAYLDPNLQAKDLLTGVNFASGGSGFDPLTSKLAFAIPLSGQIELFKEYTEKLKMYVGEERASSIISNSIFMVCTGSDDIANTYFHTPARFWQYTIDQYTDLMVTEASDFVQKSYALGARRIGIVSVPPVGCLPSQITLGGGGGGPERECAEILNEGVELFNSKVSTEVDYLKNQLSHARVVYMDAYTPFLDIVLNYKQKYGFEVANRGCCGTGLIEVAFLCNRWSPSTCQNASSFVFWDSYHPTEKAYRFLVHQMLQNNINSFF